MTASLRPSSTCSLRSSAAELNARLLMAWARSAAWGLGSPSCIRRLMPPTFVTPQEIAIRSGSRNSLRKFGFDIGGSATRKMPNTAPTVTVLDFFVSGGSPFLCRSTTRIHRGAGLYRRFTVRIRYGCRVNSWIDSTSDAATEHADPPLFPARLSGISGQGWVMGIMSRHFAD